jgi:hypothetical protein
MESLPFAAGLVEIPEDPEHKSFGETDWNDQE